jgi:hypothetical protein
MRVPISKHIVTGKAEASRVLKNEGCINLVPQEDPLVLYHSAFTSEEFIDPPTGDKCKRMAEVTGLIRNDAEEISELI